MLAPKHPLFIHRWTRNRCPNRLTARQRWHSIGANHSKAVRDGSSITQMGWRAWCRTATWWRDMGFACLIGGRNGCQSWNIKPAVLSPPCFHCRFSQWGPWSHNCSWQCYAIASHMGHGAPKDMLVTFVIGADDGQGHKNPIITIIVGNKRLGRWCGLGGSPIGRIPGSYTRFQTTPEKTT